MCYPFSVPLDLCTCDHPTYRHKGNINKGACTVPGCACAAFDLDVQRSHLRYQAGRVQGRLDAAEMIEAAAHRSVSVVHVGVKGKEQQTNNRLLVHVAQIIRDSATAYLKAAGEACPHTPDAPHVE